MYYNNIDDKTYTESEIKALYPNTSFPSPFVAPTDYVVVFDTPKPDVTELQVAYQDGTELDSKGNRVVKWSIRDIFSDTEESTKAEQEEAYLLAKFKDTVPSTITMAQCREQLIKLELDDEVEVILASIPDKIKQKIYKSAWEYNTVVKIDNAMLLELAPMLSIDLDKFFIDASKL